ncbi:DNA-binding protein [Streptomyces sp. NRRL F-5135]|uniref:DNA-binding protein n=1 Tax=Streptomyces sp. NRRL F-5135 TaxID=1463858 RepID=UPI0004C55B7E|nr:DNA-binding protein [Streptomyces sp. NRRL F-5135]
MTGQDVPTLAEVRQWPATVGVPRAAAALGVSKSHLYDLVRRGEAPIRTLSFGTSHRVVTASLVHLLEAV